jgi:hypothetical protein
MPQINLYDLQKGLAPKTGIKRSAGVITVSILNKSSKLIKRLNKPLASLALSSLATRMRRCRVYNARTIIDHNTKKVLSQSALIISHT